MFGAVAAYCGATWRKTAMALDEALHSSFSPNVATWVVNRFNVPAQAFPHKIRSLTGKAYRGSYKALIKAGGRGGVSCQNMAFKIKEHKKD